MTKADHIIEFYGETCQHCIAVAPIVEQIEKELDIKIQKLEVWHNEANRKVLEKYGETVVQACGGYVAVPSFVNTKTGQALCGSHDKTQIVNLIQGYDCTGNICQPHSKLPA